MFMVCVAAISAAVMAASEMPPDAAVVQATAQGRIDWSTRSITVWGKGPPGPRAANAAAARASAEKAATSSAQQSLLEAVRALRLSGSTSAGSVADTTAELAAALGEVVKTFHTIDTRYFADGGVDIAAELSLDAGLGELLIKAWAPSGLPAAALMPATVVPAPASSPTPAASGVPLDTPGGSSPSPLPVEVPLGEVTGIVINARGVSLKPALAPRVFGEDGGLAFGPASVGAEAMRQRGVVAYGHSLDAALKDPRVADRPLLVRALAVREETDVVVAAADAKRIAAAPAAAQGRVAVVLD